MDANAHEAEAKTYRLGFTLKNADCFFCHPDPRSGRDLLFVGKKQKAFTAEYAGYAEDSEGEGTTAS